MNGPRPCATLLTPFGRGAIASIEVSGPGAVEAIDRVFSAASGKRVADLPLRRIAFGRWSTGEELVVCHLNEERVEIHCHGGTAAVDAVVGSLVAAGVKIRSASDWLQGHEPDLIACEARLALENAKTERTALHLLDQYQGALRREADSLYEQLEQSPAASQARLDQLLERAEVGLHCTTPFRVVVAGSPNVGKSSLMNALLGYTRSIVVDEPGTTRDRVSAHTAIDGWPVELIDTAGMRETVDPIESAGVELAKDAAQSADLVLRVFDASNHGAASELVEGQRELVLLNKIDLCERRPEVSAALPISARTCEGIADLLAAIARRLVPAPPERGEPIPFRVRQCDLLAAARVATEHNELDEARRHLRALWESPGILVQTGG